MKNYQSVEEYIKSFPKSRKTLLKKVRETIKSAAPKVEEGISYGMPAYKQNGPLVYFAACEKHLGFYPTPSAINAFKDEVSVFKYSKGAVQLPYEKIPFALIKKMVKFKVKENALKTKKVSSK